MSDAVPAIVIENGSRTIRAGLSSNDVPTYLIPSVVGRPKCKDIIGVNIKDFYVGKEAQQKRGILTIRYPLQHGIVTNWDDMEKIWHHTFHDELQTNPQDHNILLSEAPFNPEQNREKMTQIMFETFEAAGLKVAISPLLSLYSVGRTTGTIMDIGEEASYCVSVLDGIVQRTATSQVHLGGGNLTEYLSRMLQWKGYHFTTTAERESVREMKEQSCYVSLDYDKDIEDSSTNNELTMTFKKNEDEISVDKERFMCPEILFNPLIIGKKCSDICTTLIYSIQRSDIDVERYKDLYANIILSGPTMVLPNIKERITKEITKELRGPSKELRNHVHVTLPMKPNHCAWIGGKMLVTQAHRDENFWILKADYEEIGPSIVHRYSYV